MTTFSVAGSWHKDTQQDPDVALSGLTAGNYIIACFSQWRGTYTADHTISDTNTGSWTKLEGHDSVMTNSTYRHSMSIWGRLVTSTDASSGPTITCVGPSNDSCALTVFEVEASASFDYTFEDAVSGTSGTADWDGTASGNTSSISGGNDILEVAVGFGRISGATTDPTAAGLYFNTQTDDKTAYIQTLEMAHVYAIEASGQADGVKSATINADGSGYPGITAVLAFSTAGGGGLTITGSDHVDGDSFGAGTVTPGAVGITGADHVDPDAFGAGSIGLVLAGVAFADGDSFGVGELNLALFGSGHDDADQFGSGIVSQGGVAITGTAHLDPDAFGSGTVAPGPVQIVGTAHVDPDSFGAGVIQSGAVLTGAAHVDPDAFGSGLIAVGQVTISGTAYADQDAFGSGAISVAGGPQTITGARHDDADSFGAGAIQPGAVGIDGAAHDDADTFGAGGIAISISGTIYVDADQFGAGEILPGGVVIVGAAHVDADTFGAGTVFDGSIPIRVEAIGAGSPSGTLRASANSAVLASA